MHQSHSRRSTRSRLGKGGYGPLNPFLFSHLKRNPANLSSLPHIFLPPWHGPCNPISITISRHGSCAAYSYGRRGGPDDTVRLARIIKRSLNGTFHNFPRKFQDRFRTVSRHRLCFAPAIMVIFLRSHHTETRSHDTIMYHQAHDTRRARLPGSTLPQDPFLDRAALPHSSR